MESLPKVSVIIPFFNCPYVDQAVASVLNQTYPNIEIIVVDDGSTMHQEHLIPYMDRIYYIGKMNGGTATALNYGIQFCTGKYIAWLSSDDRFYSTKIEHQVNFMEQHQAEASFTDYHVINKANKIICHNATAKFMTVRSFIEAFSSYCPLNGCTVMMKKDYVRNIGYFNEKLLYTHDYDFWIRIILNHTKFHYLNEPLTAYRHHEQMGTVQHYQAIVRELETVRQTYQPQLQMLLNTL
ncbi:glycosyl transferase [Paenibacillus kribbensis]|uniref:Glycosyl transferase n=1 Tax=Paenibacillus kribbensis TaxID=172713 RepID=A0A222WIT4_9BACL|nr:glycosyltransferase [Paenibacillus kribbensis]ASR46135.1 glycosyl transferase [Paenibacillus kribbensis]